VKARRSRRIGRRFAELVSSSLAMPKSSSFTFASASTSGGRFQVAMDDEVQA
jgi:hypothetical protein